MEQVFVHPSALVESDRIGPGTRVWAFAHVMAGASVGADCNIGDHTFVEAGAVVGDCVTIKNGNMIWEGVTLEDGVFVGPLACFTNDRYPRSPRLEAARERYRDRGWLAPTLVRAGASIGGGAVILAGLTIGPYAMVAAGAVVAHDVPAHALVMGAPARVAGWVCRCGQRLRVDGVAARCPACDAVYAWSGGAIVAPDDDAAAARPL